MSIVKVNKNVALSHFSSSVVGEIPSRLGDAQVETPLKAPLRSKGKQHLCAGKGRKPPRTKMAGNEVGEVIEERY